jgi:hypothetical protein
MKIYPSCIIFGEASDIHIKTVISKLDQGTIPLIIDLSKFGKEFVATYENSDKGMKISIRDKTGNIFDFSKVKYVWWRRPQPFSPVKHLNKKLAGYAIREMNCFWGGILASLNEAVWFNDFDNHRCMDRKINQLNLAYKIGFVVPATCITSDSIMANNFIEKHKEVIFKSFAGSEDFWQPTRLFKEGYGKYLDTLINCPVIFQEFIDSIGEYRVTVIADNIFTALKKTTNSRYKYDKRIDLSLKYEKANLPSEIESKLFEFMKQAGLKYGAFDLIHSKSGEVYFIEINPAGQFIHIENETAMPISGCLANCFSDNTQINRFSELEKLPLSEANGLFSHLADEKIQHLN